MVFLTVHYMFATTAQAWRFRSIYQKITRVLDNQRSVVFMRIAEPANEGENFLLADFSHHLYDDLTHFFTHCISTHIYRRAVIVIGAPSRVWQDIEQRRRHWRVHLDQHQLSGAVSRQNWDGLTAPIHHIPTIIVSLIDPVQSSRAQVRVRWFPVCWRNLCADRGRMVGRCSWGRICWSKFDWKFSLSLMNFLVMKFHVCFCRSSSLAICWHGDVTRNSQLCSRRTPNFYRNSCS